MFLEIALVQTIIEVPMGMGAILPVGAKPVYLDAPIYEGVAEAARMGTIGRVASGATRRSRAPQGGRGASHAG